MGGDHKCPVCQATFTRPQHVARHMRSHTGDRPYKCQHCGDQFARSDLLSRHVNKCHANEKPPAPTGNNRRKGAASASRATTSKQACDQCVQGSLPCDGCNPCAKCVSRKCRCTYVKFHRQTAPTGPGHHPRAPTLPTHAHLTGLPPLPSLPRDDFILGPPPLDYPQGGGFGFQGGEDFAAKYRAQAELLRRAGAGLSTSAPTGHSVIPPPGAYDSHAHHQQQQQWPGSYGSPEFGNAQGSVEPVGYPIPGAQAHYRARSGSFDYASSESGRSGSASSSSVHLPLDGSPAQRQTQMYGHPPEGSDGYGGQDGTFSSAFGLMSLDDPNVLAGLSADGAPFFSSAALAMTPGDPDATPMGARGHGQQQQGHSHGKSASVAFPVSPREMETRELREFWKQYMRTPLTGPHAANNPFANPNTNPNAPPGSGQEALPPRQRVRVASLPSAKTPTADLAVQPSYPANANGQGQHANGAGAQQRTAHGTADDLRSYEAAVLARKAPTTLNLVPKKQPRSGPGSAASPSVGYTSRPGSSASSLAGAIDDSASSHSGGGEEVLRPSFKRLPSQTLGPEHAKRAQLEYPDDGGEVGREGRRDVMGPPAVERHRRMSMPGAISPVKAGFAHVGPAQEVVQ